jgi:hypothetical protein
LAATVIVAKSYEGDGVGGPTPYRGDEKDLVELRKTLREVVEDHEWERNTKCWSNAVKKDDIGE